MQRKMAGIWVWVVRNNHNIISSTIISLYVVTVYLSIHFDHVLSSSGKGSIKLTASQGGNNPKQVYVSLSLRDEVKLNEVDSAWKPSRFRKETMTEEEYKTQV